MSVSSASGESDTGSEAQQGGAAAEIAAPNLIVPPPHHPPALRQLVRVISDQHHDPSSVDPRQLSTVLYQADLAQYEQWQLTGVAAAVRRAVRALMIATFERKWQNSDMQVLAEFVRDLGVDWPAQGLEQAQPAKFSAPAKKREYKLAELRAVGVLSEQCASMGALRNVAKEFVASKKTGLSDAAVSAFAAIRWQRQPKAAKQLPLLQAVFEAAESKAAWNDNARLEQAWASLTEFLDAVGPQDTPHGQASPLHFMTAMRMELLLPLVQLGLPVQDVIHLLEDEVLAVVANLVPDTDEDVEADPTQAWTKALQLVQPAVILKREEARTLHKVAMPGGGSVRNPGGYRAALLSAVECLSGFVLPPSWSSHCKEHNVCPVQLLMPGLCPFGDVACPMRHPDAVEREEIVVMVLGDRDPAVYALRGRVQSSGQLIHEVWVPRQRQSSSAPAAAVPETKKTSYGAGKKV